MFRYSSLVSILFLSVTFSASAAVSTDSPQSARSTTSFDQDWRFLKSDAPEAKNLNFDDAAWRKLNVPHDWSIEGPFAETNPTGGAGAFLPSGIGWYRKHFTLPSDFSQRKVFIEFDGVMANSDVWINGHHLGKRPFGYISFRYELTDHVNFGDKENVISVRADNSAQPASRWYTGAGIYRHVRLIAADPVYVDKWSTFVTTPKVSADEAVVNLKTTIVNQSDSPRIVSVQFTIEAPDQQIVQSGETDPQTIPAGKSVDFHKDITVKNPKIWSLETPVLYRALTKVRADSATIDDDATPFGIREFKFEPATGFWLNGKNFKLKGVCLHHDCGALGAAVPLRAWERRLEALKLIGVNAIRTSHNPVAPEFLDLCDRMGFLVMDEFFDCWTVKKNPFDYHLYFNEWSKIDARDTILRDRNHPSVILYSVGNEIHDTPKADLAKGILKGLVDVCHEYDPTRPVTQALFRPNVSHDYDNGLADLLDVIGTNYRDAELIAAYKAKPTRKIIGTESGHDRKIWLTLRDNPPEAGQFLWTGIDYLGESRRWPTVAAGSGLLDLTGTAKPMASERQSWWSEKPMVSIARRLASQRITAADPGFEPLNRRPTQSMDWTPANTSPHEETVEVYSNCDTVELFLNDKSLGSKTINADSAPRAWKVDFEPGVIRAEGKNKDQIVAKHELQTAGKPAKITLAADRGKLSSDWDDVSYITAFVTDEKGTPIPDANDLVTFKVDGPGEIVGVENGDRTSSEPFLASQRHAYLGRCVAIVKAKADPGRITITASAKGFSESSVSIDVIAPSTTAPIKASKSSAVAQPQSTANPNLPTLFLIGDSTVKNGQGKGDGGLWGWGYPIADYFDKNKINVENRALGGRSSRTFITEGLWDKILAEMKPGDFVMMQFGHNDGGPLDTGRARASLKGDGNESQEVVLQATGKKEVVQTYGWYLKKYIADAKAKGVTPIVLSLIPRNSWKEDKVNRASNDYGKWAADAAKEGDSLFIPLNEIVANHYELEGPQKVLEQYFTAADHTHTTLAGAKLNAHCVIEGLKELKNCKLATYLANSTDSKALKFDFGSGKVAPGYTQVLPTTIYSKELGYGFDLKSSVTAVDRGGDDALRSDFCTGNKPFFFSVALSEGNYNVTVTLGDKNECTNTTIKAESRRLMLENITTQAGEFAVRTFTVNTRTPSIANNGDVKLKTREKSPVMVLHWDDKLNLEFNGTRPCVCSMEIAKVENAITVYIAGDSTVTDQPSEPWNSWGQMLPRFFKPGVAVANHAESGEALRAFVGEKRLAKILSTIKPGDYLFVQFGHNDQKEKGPNVGAFTTYKDSLKQYVAEARKRGAIPVLVTPMHRLRLNSEGKVENSLGDYPEAVRQVAKEENVPLIDLNTMSKEFYEALGKDNIKMAFQDGTHHNNYGSYELAKCIVEGIKANKLGIAKFIVDDATAFDPNHPDPVATFNIPASPQNSKDKPDGN